MSTLIIVNHSAPGGPIDAAFAPRGRALGLQRRDRGRCRKTVQRHVDEHRVAAGRRGSGRGFETLPLRASGIVDMHVGIDQSGKNGRIAEVMKFVAIRILDP